MQALKAALRAQLVAAGVNGGTAIFDTLAPAGQPFPYLIFQYVAGGYHSTNALDERREQWQVKALTDDPSSAHSLAAAIHAALHRAPLAVTGWRCLWLVQEGSIWQVETAYQMQVYHAGATFRLHLHRSAATAPPLAL